MRIRERGIGNMPFIAVLVLFVIAVALFFMKQDEADKAKGAEKKANELRFAADKSLVKMSDAYNAMKEVVGINDAGLELAPDATPKPDDIRKILRDYLSSMVKEITQKGETTLKTKHYTAPGGEQAGDTTTLKLFTATEGGDALTFKGVIESMPKAVETASKIAVANNDKFDTVKNDTDNRVKQLREANAKQKTTYDTDLAAKQTQAEAWKDELDKSRSAQESLAARLDNDASDFSNKMKNEIAKRALVERDRNAWKGRAINEKERKELAIKEDPIDGEVLHVSSSLGTLWINLGTKHKLSRGTRFTVWRPGKGNVRQDIAVVSVISVMKTRAEARITKYLNARVHPTKGMNVSNPFYDPKGTLKVYIYGDLRTYPTDEAAKRLAASGAVVARSLDHTINVIVLGEPPKAGDEEMPEDEAEAAAAEKKAKMDRARRLDWIMQKAISIGAIVVTEDVLATFIDY